MPVLFHYVLDLLDIGLHFLISLKDIIIIFGSTHNWDQIDTFKT